MVISEVQIYYLSNRRCPIDLIWPLYATMSENHLNIFNESTKYIILGESNNISKPEWLLAGINENYVFETKIGSHEIFRIAH
jgi:hypothetical protein